MSKRPYRRFREGKSIIPDHFHVYDHAAGEIARETNGRLAYYGSRKEATAAASDFNSGVIQPGENPYR